MIPGRGQKASGKRQGSSPMAVTTPGAHPWDDPGQASGLSELAYPRRLYQGQPPTIAPE
jgi:hypothetical protein